MLWTQKRRREINRRFFELIFSAFDCNVEVELNAEEYEFWWEKVMQVCDRVAKFSGAGWAQKGALIFRSPLWKAGHELFVSILREGRRYGLGWKRKQLLPIGDTWDSIANKIKKRGERRFAALTSPEAILWGKHYRAFAEEFAGDKAKALQIRNELLAELPEGERLRAHVYAALGMRSTGRKVTWQRKLLITKKPWK